MTRSQTASVLAAALWLASPTTLLAATAQTPTPDEDADNAAKGPWTLALGVQGDRQRAYGFTSALGYDVLHATTVRVAAHGTNYQGDFSQPNPPSTRSVGAGLGVTQRLGRFGIDADVDVWHLTAVLRATQFKLGGSYAQGPYSVGLRAGYQRTTYDNFTGSATLDLGAGPVVTPVLASCTDNNTSWGADGRYQARRWGAHLSLTEYQYRHASCTLTPPGGAPVSASLDTTQFAQLASTPLGQVQHLAMPVIGDQQSLANSLFVTGVSWRQRDLQLALDYMHQRDYYVGTLGKAYFVTGTGDLGGGTAVDVVFGDTRGSGGGPRGLFGGLGMRARF